MIDSLLTRLTRREVDVVVTIKLNDPNPEVLDGRNIRASAFEPAQRQLARRLAQAFDPQVATRRALTVNAGYSPLPAVLTDHGFAVSGIDVSTAAIDEALLRRPAITQELIADPRRLPRPDGSVELVWCIDTLELTDDPETVIAELARVTAQGGRIVVDTLNSTFLSRLVYLRLFQQVPGARVMPAHRYRADRFRSPEQLSALCRSASIEVEDVIGYEPSSAPALLTSLLARRRGRITDQDLAARAGFKLSEPGHVPPVTFYLICRKP